MHRRQRGVVLQALLIGLVKRVAWLGVIVRESHRATLALVQRRQMARALGGR